MTETVTTPVYSLGPDEKTAQVMAYTANSLYWGEVVVKQLIRVSFWLKTNNAPERLCLYNAHMVFTNAGSQAKPIAFRELHIPAVQVNAFHLVPPAKDPLDYDATEPNRRMVPVTALVGSFRMDGCLRLAVQSSLSKFLDLNHEPFISIYDAQVSCPMLPSFGTLAVSYLVVRQAACVFSIA